VVWAAECSMNPAVSRNISPILIIVSFIVSSLHYSLPPTALSHFRGEGDWGLSIG
jgi:hypothetical protein